MSNKSEHHIKGAFLGRFNSACRDAHEMCGDTSLGVATAPAARSIQANDVLPMSCVQHCDILGWMTTLSTTCSLVHELKALLRKCSLQ